MSSYLKFMIGSLMIAAFATQLISAEHATATLAPARTVFVSGEPIDLVLTLHNEADVPVVVMAAYPVFRDEYGKPGISLTANGRNLNTAVDTGVADTQEGPLGVPRGLAGTWMPGGVRPASARIKPRRSWSIKIFLQHFTHDLGPGDYEITYAIDIPPELPEGGHGKPFRGKGEFKITIIAATDTELSAALVRHAQPGDDYWSGRAKIEGLALVRLPVVIPYLTHTAAGGDNKVILAIAKFKGNRDAEVFVLEKLRSEGAVEILAALSVLQEWKYILPEREMWRLLNLPSTLSAARVGAILYAASVPGDIFRTQVRGLINDPDPYIAETARRAYPTTLSDQLPK